MVGAVTEQPLAKALQQQGLLDEKSLADALSQAQSVHLPLIEYLLQEQLLPAADMAKAIAAYLHLPLYDLATLSVHKIPILLDEGFIQKYQLLPLSQDANQIKLAISEPEQGIAIDQLKFTLNASIQLVVVEHDLLKRMVHDYLHLHNYQKLIQIERHDVNQDNDQRIISFVQQILADAIQKRASDIHIEADKNDYQIRLRIDGLLYKTLTLPKELAIRIVTRLKVMAKLDIAERRLPQDGRMTIHLENKKTRDCRVNSCPTLQGEKLVLRLLDSTKAALNIQELGLESEQLELLINSLERPQGMILVTGPTGSGKTITLYASLNQLNVIHKNILTVEDPVEIELNGINQVHVNLKAGLSFATALRAFLRQDPDIIMVGEIRDQETAEIAIKAAQTGHLVLSTLHANSAVETLTRLVNMGIAPFNIAYSTNLIVAQRLARKLCHFCKIKDAIENDLLIYQGFDKEELDKLILYKAMGCDKCYQGYAGRIGIFELLPMTESIIQILLNQPGNSAAIMQEAQRFNFVSLKQAALNKVRLGVTSLAEIQRVIMM